MIQYDMKPADPVAHIYILGSREEADAYAQDRRADLRAEGSKRHIRIHARRVRCTNFQLDTHCVVDLRTADALASVPRMDKLSNEMGKMITEDLRDLGVL